MRQPDVFQPWLLCPVWEQNAQPNANRSQRTKGVIFRKSEVRQGNANTNADPSCQTTSNGGW
jgi:hypothetical protein